MVCQTRPQIELRPRQHPPTALPNDIDDSKRLSDETADLAEQFDDEEFKTALSALH